MCLCVDVCTCVCGHSCVHVFVRSCVMDIRHHLHPGDASALCQTFNWRADCAFPGQLARSYSMWSRTHLVNARRCPRGRIVAGVLGIPAMDSGCSKTRVKRTAQADKLYNPNTRIGLAPRHQTCVKCVADWSQQLQYVPTRCCWLRGVRWGIQFHKQHRRAP